METREKFEKERLSRLKDFFNKKKVGPFTLDIKLTNQCNLDCIFCPTKVEYEKLDKRELSDEKWIGMIEQAAKLDVKEVYIGGGGEPLVRKELLLKLMKIIKKNNMKGILITNGTLFSKENIKNIVEIKWDDIFFSIDGATSNTHDSLRAKEGAFKQVLNSISLFNKAKKLPEDKPVLHVSTVLVNKNYKELPALIELLKRYGIESLFLQKFIPWSKESINLDLNPKQIGELPTYFEKAMKLAKEYGVVTNLSKFMDMHPNDLDVKNVNQICSMPFLYFCIRPEGIVQPCMSKSDLIIGDIKKQNVEEVWYGQKMRDFRQALINGKQHSFCETCCAKITNNELEDLKDKNG